MKYIFFIFLTTIFISCQIQRDDRIEYSSLTTDQKRFNEYFLHEIDSISLNEFYNCKGDVLKLHQFFEQKNLPTNLLPTLVTARNSCTGGMCGYNLVNKNLVTQFNLASNAWRPRWAQPLYDEIMTNNIPFNGPGIIIIFGNGSCPYANASAIASVGSNKTRYYYIGTHGLHSCSGVVTGPIPFFNNYSGMTITSQLSCLYPSEISQNSILLASMFQCIPFFGTIAEDGSNIIPGGYWVRYGVSGYGLPNGNTDAEIEMSHASVYGVN